MFFKLWRNHIKKIFATTVTVKATENTIRNCRNEDLWDKTSQTVTKYAIKDTMKAANGTMMSSFVEICTSEADSTAFRIDNG